MKQCIKNQLESKIVGNKDVEVVNTSPYFQSAILHAMKNSTRASAEGLQSTEVGIVKYHPVVTSITTKFHRSRTAIQKKWYIYSSSLN